MNCEQAKQLMSNFYDAELDVDVAHRFAKHLAGCNDCRAELEAFERLSSAILLASPAAAPADGWQRIAARLDAPAGQLACQEAISGGAAAAMNRTQAPAQPAVRLRPKVSRRVVLALAAAFAASMLIMVVIRWQSANDSLAGSFQVDQPSTVALDYSTVIKQQAREPSQALQAVSDRYHGREVATANAEDALGYRPAILSAVPAKTRLVSTRLLKLPNCSCAGGQCQCGPQGCNCAACLCQRDDGSEFLIFEHCKTQDVSFGKFETRIASDNSRRIQLIDAGQQLAVSWIAGARRLTAIGLKDESEARSLVATLDKVASLQ